MLVSEYDRHHEYTTVLPTEASSADKFKEKGVPLLCRQQCKTTTEYVLSIKGAIKLVMDIRKSCR